MSNQQQLQKHRQSVMTLLIIASVFMVLTMFEGIALYILRNGLNHVKSLSRNMNSMSMTDLTFISTMLNAALNSFICICRSKKLRQFYAHLIKIKINST